MLYPADVSGKYQTRRRWISIALIGVFLCLPWVKIGGGQALLFDFWRGRFSVFGLRFWSHDAPMFLFVFGGAAILLAFVTAVWGRVWCGWACPQTVFVNSVFRRVERWIEGDAVNRRKLAQSPWNGEKIFKRGAKWAVYAVLALILSHSFLAYFIGTDNLLEMMRRSPSRNMGSFLGMAFIAGAVLFDFGWFREQFCTQICPYGRFQSVLMDERSMAVAYQPKRGEPRRGVAASKSEQGDCVDCLRCVQVCPTGIDIRNGLQLECIACTACIDACDTVMTRLGKPQGLIRYESVPRGRGLLRPRPLAYLSLLLAMAAALTLTLQRRQPVEITLIRTVGAPYQEIVKQGAEREIVNHFKADLLNSSFEEIHLGFRVPALLRERGVEVVSADLPVTLAPGETRRINLFWRFPAGALTHGRLRAPIEFVSGTSPNQIQEVTLVGPLR